MSFIRRRLRLLFWTIVLTDLTESFIYPYRHLYDIAFVAPGTTGYALRSWCTLVWLVMTYAILKLYYVLGSLLAVALGISRPEVWPDTFGKWEDAYTLRRLWGYVLLAPILARSVCSHSRQTYLAPEPPSGENLVHLPGSTQLMLFVSALFTLGEAYRVCAPYPARHLALLSSPTPYRLRPLRAHTRVR